MLNSYSSLCDDFFVDMHINTELDLPSERDTVLSFFERIKKQFPAMGNFHRRDTGDFCIEEERQGEKYRWLTLELDRIVVSCANPESMDDPYELNTSVLETIPYMLGVNGLDVDSLDLTFTMDFDYRGNHNEIITEALYGDSSFSRLLNSGSFKPLGYSPMTIISLSDDCYRQARIAVESRTSINDVRIQKYKTEDPISLYMTIRHMPRPTEKFDMIKSFEHQCRSAEELMADKIIPFFAQPLINAIAQRR